MQLLEQKLWPCTLLSLCLADIIEALEMAAIFVEIVARVLYHFYCVFIMLHQEEDLQSTPAVMIYCSLSFDNFQAGVIVVASKMMNT